MRSCRAVLVGALVALSACTSGLPAPDDLGTRQPDDAPRPDVIGVVDHSVLERTGVTPIPYEGEIHLADGTSVVIDDETTRVWDCSSNDPILVGESGYLPDQTGCLGLFQLSSDGPALQIRYLNPVPGSADRWHLVGTPSAISTTMLVLADVFVSTSTAFEIDPDDDDLRAAVLRHEGECAEGARLADMVFEVDARGRITAFVGYGAGEYPFDSACAYVV